MPEGVRRVRTKAGICRLAQQKQIPAARIGGAQEMSLYKQQRSKNWWIKIYKAGQREPIRVSTGTSDLRLAKRLHKRLVEETQRPLSEEQLFENLQARLDREKE
jgi:hypothetical protein